jgi:hypothetical protein
MSLTSEEITLSAQRTRRLSRLQWYEEKLRGKTREVAQLLKELRDDPEKPYLAVCENFEAYCEDKLGMSPRRARQLMAAENVRQFLCDAEPGAAEAVGAMKEGPMREIVAAPAEKRVAVLQEALKESPRPTARQIKQARARVVGDEPAKPVCPRCGRAMP